MKVEFFDEMCFSHLNWLDWSRLGFKWGGNILDVAISILLCFLLGHYDHGVHGIDPVPPFVKEADFLIQVWLKCIYKLNVLFNESIRVADYWDQEVCQYKANEQQVQEPDVPREEDHEIRIDAKRLIIQFSFQIGTPLAIVWHRHIGQWVTPRLEQVGDVNIEVWVIITRIGRANWSQHCSEDEDPKEHEGKENLNVWEGSTHQCLE